MTLEYNLKDDDIIEFQLFHVRKSAAMQASIRFWSLLIPVILMITIVALDQLMTNFSRFFLIFGFGVSIVLAAGYRFVYYYLIKRYTKKMLKEGDNKGLTGKQRLKIKGDSVTITDGKGKLEYEEPFINRIAENNRFYYIYISSVSAYIVPKGVFESEEEKSGFLDLLSSFIMKEPESA